MTDKTGPSKCSVETDETAAVEAENDRYRDRRIAHNLPSTRPTAHSCHTTISANTPAVRTRAFPNLFYYTCFEQNIYKFCKC
jgi:hypothetical protein